MVAWGNVIAALRHIRRHPLRSSLVACTGMMGVVMVVAVAGLFDGLVASVQSDLYGAGLDVVWLRPRITPMGVMRGERLGTAQVEALREALPGKPVVPVRQRKVLASTRDGRETSVDLLATTDSFKGLFRYDTRQGRFLTERDVKDGESVCVIEHQVWERLFDGGNAIGKRLELTGRGVSLEAEVVGVLGTPLDEDVALMRRIQTLNRVFVPITALPESFSEDLSVIAVKTMSLDSIADASTEAVAALRATGRRATAEHKAAWLDEVGRHVHVLATLGFVLSGACIVSGCLAVTTILLVAMGRRSREIATRKVEGATNADIVMQFLLESLIICLSGGLVGIPVGFAGAHVLSALTVHWQIVFNPTVIWRTVLLSAAVGCLAGVLPAYRAARMDPVVAMKES